MKQFNINPGIQKHRHMSQVLMNRFERRGREKLDDWMALSDATEVTPPSPPELPLDGSHCDSEVTPPSQQNHMDLPLRDHHN